jgi:hypothetical protein
LALSNLLIKNKLLHHEIVTDLKSLDYEVIKKMSFAFQTEDPSNFSNEASIYYIGTTLYLSNSFIPDISEKQNAILCASIRYNDTLNQTGFFLFFKKPRI